MQARCCSLCSEAHINWHQRYTEFHNAYNLSQSVMRASHSQAPTSQTSTETLPVLVNAERGLGARPCLETKLGHPSIGVALGAGGGLNTQKKIKKVNAGLKYGKHISNTNFFNKRVGLGFALALRAPKNQKKIKKLMLESQNRKNCKKLLPNFR